MIICIILFRISYDFAPNFMNYSQDHCQNNLVTLEINSILQYITALLEYYNVIHSSSIMI